MATKLAFALVVSFMLSRSNVSAAGTLNPRLDVGGRFSMYAYGNNINGLPILFADGKAVIADFDTASKTDDLVPVSFTATSGAKVGGFVFTATPNTTAPVKNKATLSPPFTNATWFVPARGSSSKNVGFLTDLMAATDDVVANGFQLTERSVALQEAPDKFLMSLWCAYPTERPGIWSLTWNETIKKPGKYPIVLRDFVTSQRLAFNPDATCRSDM